MCAEIVYINETSSTTSNYTVTLYTEDSASNPAQSNLNIVQELATVFQTIVYTMYIITSIWVQCVRALTFD